MKWVDLVSDSQSAVRLHYKLARVLKEVSTNIRAQPQLLPPSINLIQLLK